MYRLTVLLLATGLLFPSALRAHETSVTPLFQANLDDLKKQEGLMLVVDFPPGVKGAGHRHNAHTFVYVWPGQWSCK